jgi:hypothetical protein
VLTSTTVCPRTHAGDADDFIATPFDELLPEIAAGMIVILT